VLGEVEAVFRIFGSTIGFDGASTVEVAMSSGCGTGMSEADMLGTTETVDEAFEGMV